MYFAYTPLRFCISSHIVLRLLQIKNYVAKIASITGIMLHSNKVWRLRS